MFSTDVCLYQICLLAKLFMINSKLVETSILNLTNFKLFKIPFVTIFYWLHPPDQFLSVEITYLCGHFDVNWLFQPIGNFNQSYLVILTKIILVKTTVLNWFSQMHPDDLCFGCFNLSVFAEQNTINGTASQSVFFKIRHSYTDSQITIAYDTFHPWFNKL